MLLTIHGGIVGRKIDWDIHWRYRRISDREDRLVKAQRSTVSLPVVDWVEKNIEEINAVLLRVLLVFISNISFAITSNLLSKLHDKTIN